MDDADVMRETAKDTTGETPKWVKTLLYVAAFGVAGYAYDNWDFVSTRYLGLPYTCKNIIPDVVETSSKNQTLVRIVGIIDYSETSNTAERVECTGTGMMSNGSKAPIAYRAYSEGGQWWVSFEPLY